MTITYGLRNPMTGRIIRLVENRAFHGDSSCYLSESPNNPYWQVANFADLVTTWTVDPTEKESDRKAPEWRFVNPHACQPIGFITEVEHDVNGGDPVSRTERLVTFEIGSVYDLREPINRTMAIETQHYGIMQETFTRYDMDRIDTMSLAIVWHEGHLHLRGDIGLTHDKGPARIVEVADIPAHWPLTEEQMAYQPFPEAKVSLLLLDTAELVTWLDFEPIHGDSKLAKTA
jgi:hypothetical protein